MVESLISTSTLVFHRTTKIQTLTSQRVCNDQLPHEISSRCIKTFFDADWKTEFDREFGVINVYAHQNLAALRSLQSPPVWHPKELSISPIS